MTAVTTILTHRALILQGTMLAVDPSVGSSSSMPGWAWYEKGVLVSSGTLQVPLSGTLQERLRAICYAFATNFGKPDVLAIELITQWGRRKVDSLLKGVGAIMAGVHCEVCVEISPSAWHLLEPPGYEKGDEWDAIAIGHYVLHVAQGKEVPTRARHTRTLSETFTAADSPSRRPRSPRRKLGKARRPRGKSSCGYREIRHRQHRR